MARRGRGITTREPGGSGGPTTWDSVSGKPMFATVATSGSYNDLTDKPTFSTVTWSTLQGKPTFSTVAISGAYGDLSGRPDLSGYATSAALSTKYNTPTGTVSQYVRGDGSLAAFPALFSGSYSDLADKPTIPAAQVNSNWSATSGITQILNKPDLSTYATVASVTSLSSAVKRIETYTGTTDANGLYSVTYATAFPAIPSIQPEPPLAGNQVWIKVSSTTTGFSLRLMQRNSVNLLATELLLAAMVNVPSAPARVVVIAA